MNRVSRTIKRRRREAKTDYNSRLSLLMSKSPRLVVRKTNRYVIAQIVRASIAQDSVIVGVSSKDLLQHGWPESHAGSLKSLAAAYLTGLLLAGKAKLSTPQAILDIGMQRNVKNSRIYAALRGVVDGGLNVPHNASALPDDKRLESNPRTRELLIKLKGTLHHGRKGNKE
ncbi:MAG TPA: 50S ribosomal protein L18 [Candidatus Nanoarchaeia archaeon]|nr:50S ribosomal protein L18 [Candidatus Nanoarchaeia archaeon]